VEATDEDLHLFAVSAHGIKSALANIGETEASKLAFVLEKAGKGRDKNIIRMKTNRLIETVQEIIIKIEKEIKTPTVMQDENPAYLREQLKIISTASAAYDEETANAALANLEKMSWTKETKELLAQISKHLLHSEFEETSDIAVKFLAR
jgi:HPt (histidine-containing phosphotransfer) domain-containing protein